MRVDESSVDTLVGILLKFGLVYGLEVKWHKNVAYWCSQGTPPNWVEKFQWKWAANGYLSKLLGTPFGLYLELQNVDQFLVNKVKGKLKY